MFLNIFAYIREKVTSFMSDGVVYGQEVFHISPVMALYLHVTMSYGGVLIVLIMFYYVSESSLHMMVFSCCVIHYGGVVIVLMMFCSVSTEVRVVFTLWSFLIVLFTTVG